MHYIPLHLAALSILQEPSITFFPEETIGSWVALPFTLILAGSVKYKWNNARFLLFTCKI